MLVTLVPLFDENMAVCAYTVLSRKQNLLLTPMMLGTAQLDGASRIVGLEVIQNMGMETLSADRDVFVPVSNISLFSDIERQCDAPHSRIVLLIDATVSPTEMNINRLKELKNKKYKLAIRKLAVADFENYREVLKLMDYVWLDSRRIVIDKAKVYFGTLYPDVKLCACNIKNKENFEQLRAQGGYQLYEGDFYRVAITRGQNEVSPLKVNYIELLNMVNSDNFELTIAADVIGRDTALTISLLKMVNRMSMNAGITTIRHAAAMLGQRELKKWINTAVVDALCTDKPSEVTRISLLRAKFAENLAASFGLAMKKEELFLLGLFSVLDVILDQTMEEALEMVNVSKDISEALLSGKGKFAPVLSFLLQYEIGNWEEVSRQMILQSIDEEEVSNAYNDSLKWYRSLMGESVKN